MTKHLDLRFETWAFKALDKGEPAGTYEAVVAAFGNVDRHSEALVSGALDESLALALPPVVYSHDWLTPPIGTTAEMAEISRADVERLTGKAVPEDVTGGLYAKSHLFVDDVPLSKHVYTALKNTNGDGSGALREHSVGLNVEKESFERRDNDVMVVLLERATCLEHGPCIKGINPATSQIATKADDIRRLIAKGVLNAEEVRAALELDITAGIDSKGALPVSQLPFTARGHAFDSDAARTRIKTWATDDDGNVDFTKYAKAFLWVDDGDGASTKLTSYRFAVADVTGDDNLKYVPKGIFAAAGVLNGARGGTTIPKAGQTALKKSVDTLYARMRKQFDDESIVTNWKASSSPAERLVLADLLFA